MPTIRDEAKVTEVAHANKEHEPIIKVEEEDAPEGLGHLNDIEEHSATQEGPAVSKKRALDSDDDVCVTKKRKVDDTGSDYDGDSDGSPLFFKESVFFDRSGGSLKIKLKVAGPKEVSPTTKTDTTVDSHQERTESKTPPMAATPGRTSPSKKRALTDEDEETPINKKPKVAECDDDHLDNQKLVNDDSQVNNQEEKTVESVETAPIVKRSRPIVWDSDEDIWIVEKSDNKRKRGVDDDEEIAAKKRRYDVVRPESDKENKRTKAATKGSRKLAEPRTRKQPSVMLADKQTNAPGALKAQADKTSKDKPASKPAKSFEVAKDEPKKTTKRGKRGKKQEPKPERLTTGQRRRLEKVKPDLRTPDEIEYSKTFGRRWD
ncbi:hypothetical protein LTR10_021615 [Elasticomyces elasticus]|uniref:Uncharacterized protein n=1 Tax=Exophiala sideris TaxID=1016849 RepID=A0ABR0J470_9EURO|nr:hypothetical protein LTR10_021615 [Elasticomyces elasticus]KAK5024141.1 hypothetical protein LTS07_008876 [Exophiala sideris]KAK5028999.1 hypothetical protein LTR13_008869 [Exophiala sideris]KAK5054853.1 hypothetical protein LTR69_008761 [Exophiala sideris]KAK5178822.1 hypothetical protein LTR44_008650 [Eurotiomycetes sp. CCFEE 6388]